MAQFDFSQLPEELVDIVMEGLSDIRDFVQFGATCKAPQSVVTQTRRRQNHCFSPCLMLTNDDADAQNLRTFFCLSTKREFTIHLPDIHGWRCWGSPYGWMITFGLDLNIHLLNPFSGVRLSLPHQSTFPNQYKKKREPDYIRKHCPVRFSLAPNSESWIVIAVYNPNGKLSFAKLGDEAWTSIDIPIQHLEDAIYFNGKVYAANVAGTLVVCDIHVPHPKGTFFGSPPLPNSVRCGKHYLFEMSGELHVAVRYFETVQDKAPAEDAPPPEIIVDARYLRCVTNKFEVYKLDFQTKCWRVVSELGSSALFIGFNTSFVISTSEYSDFKQNAIYYSDDHWDIVCNQFCDMSVFDLQKKTVEPFYFGTNVLSKYSRPIFILPSL